MAVVKPFRHCIYFTDHYLFSIVFAAAEAPNQAAAAAGSSGSAANGAGESARGGPSSGAGGSLYTALGGK